MTATINLAQWFKVAFKDEAYRQASVLTKRTSVKRAALQGVIFCPCGSNKFAIDHYALTCLKCRKVVFKAQAKETPKGNSSFRRGLGAKEYFRLLCESNLYDKEELARHIENFVFNKQEKALIWLLKTRFSDRQTRIYRAQALETEKIGTTGTRITLLPDGKA